MVAFIHVVLKDRSNIIFICLLLNDILCTYICSNDFLSLCVGEHKFKQFVVLKETEIETQ